MIALAVYTAKNNIRTDEISMHYGASYVLCIVSWLGAWLIAYMSIVIFIMGRNSASQYTQAQVDNMPS